MKNYGVEIEDLITKVIDLSDEKERIVFTSFLKGLIFSLERKKASEKLLAECVLEVVKG